MNVHIGSYGYYSTPNYGMNTLYARFDGVTVYYSYRTPIAVSINGRLYISENVWSVTTGKHLNWINDDKSIRIPNSEFTEILESIKLDVELTL